MIAAGVAFYGFLAIPPGLGVAASVYGLIADPADIRRQIEEVSAALSPETRRFLSQQLTEIGGIDRTGLSATVLIGVALALWSAGAGMAALVRGIRIAVGADLRQRLLRRRLAGVALTVGAMAFVLLVLAVITALPAVMERAGLGSTAEAVLDALRWPLVWLATSAAFAVLYELAARTQRPLRRPAPAVAAAVWLLASALLSVYVSNFASYERTYGPLASIVVVMIWLYAGALAVLFGAVLDHVATSAAASERSSAEGRTP